MTSPKKLATSIAAASLVGLLGLAYAQSDSTTQAADGSAAAQTNDASKFTSAPPSALPDASMGNTARDDGSRADQGATSQSVKVTPPLENNATTTAPSPTSPSMNPPTNMTNPDSPTTAGPGMNNNGTIGSATGATTNPDSGNTTQSGTLNTTPTTHPDATATEPAPRSDRG